ncbi:MAG: polyhydroxyalkanoic acid system family protein [Sphingosinicella sp.]
MNAPVQVDLPHRLGADEARRRIDGGIDKLQNFLPGAAEVRHAWTGDQLGLNINTLGQEVNARIDVKDSFVRVELMLPPALAFFGKAIEAGLRHQGRALLEDKSKT